MSRGVLWNIVVQLPRVYPILDSGAGPWPAFGLAAAVSALLEGGARIVQIRHKGHWGRAIFAEAGEAVRLCRDAGAVAIVNDRADIAALLGAGLHVGQDDLAPRDARIVLGPSAPLGLSSHNPEQLRLASKEPVDYVALGPVFPTQTKRNPDPVVGVEQVRSCRALTTKPLVAIGGITRATARAVLEAGADSVAVIGDLMPKEAGTRALRERMEEWRRVAGT
jgi:thiamine-phosphate pyrophosphorylase